MDKYTAGILLTGILIPMVGLYIRRRQAKIDLETRIEAKAVDAPQVTIGLLTDQVAKREKELADLRSLDRVERDQYLKTLIAIERTMDEIATDLKSLREEERAGRAGLHQQIDGLDKRLIKIETRLEPN